MRLLTAKHMQERLGVSLRTISRWVDAGILPRPTRINGGYRYWLEDEITAVFDTRFATQNAGKNDKPLITQDISNCDRLEDFVIRPPTSPDIAGHKVLCLERDSLRFQASTYDTAGHGQTAADGQFRYPGDTPQVPK